MNYAEFLSNFKDIAFDYLTKDIDGVKHKNNAAIQYYDVVVRNNNPKSFSVFFSPERNFNDIFQPGEHKSKQRHILIKALKLAKFLLQDPVLKNHTTLIKNNKEDITFYLSFSIKDFYDRILISFSLPPNYFSSNTISACLQDMINLDRKINLFFEHLKRTDLAKPREKDDYSFYYINHFFRPDNLKQNMVELLDNLIKVKKCSFQSGIGVYENVQLLLSAEDRPRDGWAEGRWELRVLNSVLITQINLDLGGALGTEMIRQLNLMEKVTVDTILEQAIDYMSCSTNPELNKDIDTPEIGEILAPHFLSRV